jgi:hypothetical protein
MPAAYLEGLLVPSPLLLQAACNTVTLRPPVRMYLFSQPAHSRLDYDDRCYRFFIFHVTPQQEKDRLVKIGMILSTLNFKIKSYFVSLVFLLKSMYCLNWSNYRLADMLFLQLF